MLQASDRFHELMESNVRPKCEPTITVKDALGTGRDLIWSANNISKMTYKRGIDPIGRTLPFMELRWTEVYQGSLNQNNYPQIYENVASFLPVTLKFNQSLDFYNSWKTIYDSGKTWKDIFDEKITWKQLKEQAVTESFEFPTLFLSGKPTVKDNTIEWVAYDLLHYLDMEQSLYFPENAHIWKIFCFILHNCSSAYLKNKPIIEALQKSIKYKELFNDESEIGYQIILDGASNSLLKDYLAVFSRFLDFKEDFVFSKEIFEDFSESDFYFPLSIQYKTPTITKNSNISSYQYKQYYVQENADRQYEKEWDSYETVLGPIEGNQDFYIFKYVYDNFGKIVGENTGSSLKNGFRVLSLPMGTIPTKDNYKASVIPIEKNSVEIVFSNDVYGEVFIEDNKLCGFPPDNETSFPNQRKTNLSMYFNSQCDSLEISCAPNVSLETGDIISVETDLKNAIGENITKQAVIVENCLEYSGKLTQTIRAHEVKI